MFGDANSVSYLNHGLFSFSLWFAVQNGQKVGILNIFWYQVYWAFFSRFQGCGQLRKFLNVLVSIVFYVTLRYIFQGSYCTFSKCRLSVIHCRGKLNSSWFAYVFKLSSNFSSLVYPILFGSLLFCNQSQNSEWTVSLQSFVFILFVSTVLSNRSRRTSRYLSPLLFWLVYQRMLGPNTKFRFCTWQMLSFSWIYA